MTFSIPLEPVPLEFHPDGVVRVGGTRVTLDTVVAAFNQGATAEEIASQYPSLQLADIYATIAFYLRRQEDVENYLQQRKHRAEEIRLQNQRRFDTEGVRDRLLARRGRDR
ncbi:MAG: DUF433 domain-containing protein [Limnospira sp.]